SPLSFFLYRSGAHRDLHSFPTRRSSDLVLGGALLLLRAVGFWLDAFGLLFSPRGAVFGAAYADLHATLPALRLLMVLAAASGLLDRKSTRLNSSHLVISYAVFCLKKKKN